MKDVKEKEMLEKILIDPSIHPRMKAGCIGEFTVSTQQVCQCVGTKTGTMPAKKTVNFAITKVTRTE